MTDSHKKILMNPTEELAVLQVYDDIKDREIAGTHSPSTAAEGSTAGNAGDSLVSLEIKQQQQDILQYQLNSIHDTKSSTAYKRKLPDYKPPTARQKWNTFWRQFVALVKKNFILKTRSKGQTCCEILTPVLLLSVLSFGWVLSLRNVENIPSAIYANNTQLITRLFSQVSNPNCAELFASLITGGNLSIAGNVSSQLSESATGSFSSNPFFGGETSGGSNQTACIPASILSDINSYSGPFPVISFDTYVSLALAFQSFVNQSSNLQAALERLQIAASQYNSLVYLGKLSFAPNTPAVRKLVAELNASSTTFNRAFYKIFDTEDAGIADAVSAKGLKDRTWALVVFNSLNMSSGDVDFKIRMNYTTVPSTNQLYLRYKYTFDNNFLGYYISGFLSLQSFISNHILSQVENSSVFPQAQHSSFTATPFPNRELNNFNNFYNQVGNLVGFFMCMSMLYPVSRLIKAVVEEKENRSRENMKIMGMKGSAFVASWFFTYFLLFTLIAILITFLLIGTFVTFSRASVVFIFIYSFCLSLIPFAFMISVFFDKAKLAAIVGPVVLFVFVIPRYAFFSASQNQAIPSKRASCILSPTAFAFGADLLMTYEGAQVGIGRSELNNDDPSFGFTIGMMVFDFFLYCFLAWYLDNVIPGEFGSKRKFYFLLQPSYWGLKTKNRKSRSSSMKAILLRKESAEEVIEQSQGNNIVEHVGQDLAYKAVVEINDLRKVFIHGSGYFKKEVIAVRGLNLTMYEGQITCLLGHNGAGKSTVISMITGLFPPTSGECLIDGYNIREDIDEIRNFIGVCPQQNVIFDTLTVREHLLLYAALKNIPSESVNQEILQKIDEVGLSKKKDAFANTLSGGMKRKLCLAIALLGDSRVVLVDEPTSGMDPYSRRATWDLLRRHKRNRVIVLTTHFMDEADLLGDRIAIMADGRLKCVGSSLFLKSRFGIGYNLTLVTDLDQRKKALLAELIMENVPRAEIVSEAGAEVAYRLPFEYKPNFPQLFEKLEERKPDLGVSSYGISLTTLEEVFLSVAKYEVSTTDNALEDKKEMHENDQVYTTMDDRQAFLKGRNQLPLQNVSALSQILQLYWKRWVCAKRDMYGRFFEVLLPIIMVAMTLLILTISFDPAGPAVQLNNSLFTSFNRAGKLDTYIPYSPAKVSPSVISYLDMDTGVILDNRTESNGVLLSEYLLSTLKNHPGTRYGAYLWNDTIPLIPLNSTIDFAIRLAGAALGIRNGFITGSVTLDLLTLLQLPILLPFGGFNNSSSVFLPSFPNTSEVSTIAQAINSQIQLAIQELNASYLQVSVNFNPVVLNSTQLNRIFDPLESSNAFEITLSSGGRFDSFSLAIPALIILNNSLDLNFSVPLSNVSNTIQKLNRSLSSLEGERNILISNLTLENADFGSRNESLSESISFTQQVLVSLRKQSTLTIEFNVTQATVPELTLLLLVLGNGPLRNATFVFQNATLTVNQLTSTLISFNSPSSNESIPVTLQIPLADAQALSSSLQSFTLNLNSSSINATQLIIAAPVIPNPFNVTLMFELNGTTITTQNLTLVRDLLVDLGSIPATYRLPVPNSANVSRIVVQLLRNSTVSLPIGNIGTMSVVNDIWHFNPTVTVLHNTSSYHSLPAAAASLVESSYRSILNRSTASFKVTTHPLPLTPTEKSQFNTFLSVLAALFVLVPFCYLPAAFSIFIVKERISKAQHIQLVSGASPFAYWVSTYLWDITNYLFIVGIVQLVFQAFGNAEFVGTPNKAAGTFVLILLFGFSTIPLSYLYSFGFDSPSAAQVAISAIHFVTGFVLVVASFIMDNVETTKYANSVMKPYYRLIPPYNLGEGLLTLTASRFIDLITGTQTNAFSWDILGRNLVYMAVESVVLFLMIIIRELHFFDSVISKINSKLSNPQTRALMNFENSIDADEDDDVKMERQAVEKDSKEGILLIKNMRKVYPGNAFRRPVVAVRNLSLSVPAGECFGFLGINGAGKTTAMSILTGDFPPTGGNAAVKGYDILKEMQKVRQVIGYCPQFDPLLDLMTGREHLILFARLRGVKKRDLNRLVDTLIDQIGLTKFADKVSSSYSGGNKRKLSLGIALIGNPSLVMLDEPSSGMI